jgi:hypothetical protein
MQSSARIPILQFLWGLKHGPTVEAWCRAMPHSVIEVSTDIVATDFQNARITVYLDEVGIVEKIFIEGLIENEDGQGWNAVIDETRRQIIAAGNNPQNLCVW